MKIQEGTNITKRNYVVWNLA